MKTAFVEAALSRQAYEMPQSRRFSIDLNTDEGKHHASITKLPLLTFAKARQMQSQEQHEPLAPVSIHQDCVKRGSQKASKSTCWAKVFDQKQLAVLLPEATSGSLGLQNTAMFRK